MYVYICVVCLDLFFELSAGVYFVKGFWQYWQTQHIFEQSRVGYILGGAIGMQAFVSLQCARRPRCPPAYATRLHSCWHVPKARTPIGAPESRPDVDVFGASSWSRGSRLTSKRLSLSRSTPTPSPICRCLSLRATAPCQPKALQATGCLSRTWQMAFFGFHLVPDLP